MDGLGRDHLKCGNWHHRVAASERWTCSHVNTLVEPRYIIQITNYRARPLVLFWALFVWVFEIQLLLQIIINRTAVIVDDRRIIGRIRVSNLLFAAQDSVMSDYFYSGVPLSSSVVSKLLCSASGFLPTP